MKRTVRLTESDLHRIVKECVNRAINEVALKGKSGKTYSLHGNDGESWYIATRLRQKKSGNSNYNTMRDEKNAEEIDTKKHPNRRSLNNAKRVDALLKRTSNASKDIMAANESKLSRIVRESVNRVLRESTKYSEEIMNKIADAYENSIKWSLSRYGNGNWKATFINELAWIIVDNNLTVEDMANYGNVLKVIDANTLQQEVDNCIRANRLDQMDDERREHEAWAEEQMSNMGFGFEGD